ncbi:MAG TPA: hypothetical protein PLJ35_21630 [Anaerolineae bacterium]|nr:hypothetical protein [Anaerolineae bacterium]HOR01422.1 hypothetical protein [Anaerolineae bacterium]HPL30013.1 hypothetical protein [Anaerolineae bacterium]
MPIIRNRQEGASIGGGLEAQEWTGDSTSRVLAALRPDEAAQALEALGWVWEWANRPAGVSAHCVEDDLADPVTAGLRPSPSEAHDGLESPSYEPVGRAF